jgi:hypothetical protein
LEGYRKAEGSGTDVGVVVIGIPVLYSPIQHKRKPARKYIIISHVTSRFAV